MMDRLEESFRQIKRFSADASHELKTPLAVMQGKIEAALQNENQSRESNLVLVDLLERVGQLRSIIESLLMLSRSDAGGFVMETSELDISEIMSEITEDAVIIASEQGIELDADNGRSGMMVEGDERLLRLAISNLLTNATKYNLDEKGKITCNLSQSDFGFDILIQNTGPEIHIEDKEKIFERFYRVDPARGSTKPGFGLGLSLARVITLAHGGDLILKSSEGGLNSFLMTIPHININD